MAKAQIVAHASPRAISGVTPENPVRRDAEHHTRDAYAPRPTRRCRIWKVYFGICSKQTDRASN
jgi:hypothetical protein